MEEIKQDAAANNKNLIINYLPQTLTDDAFCTMFSEIGAIQQCRIMRNMQTGYSFGYGFVQYTNPDDSDKAIAALDGRQLLNKKIKVSFARPPGQDIRDTNLYVQYLPKNIEESYLDELFSQYGKIVQRRLLLDKQTQQPRGVAFVRFSRREDAQAAIAGVNGRTMPGATRPINVKVAEDYSKSKQMHMMQYMAGGAPTGSYMARGRGAGLWPRGGGRGRGTAGAGGLAARPPRPYFGSGGGYQQTPPAAAKYPPSQAAAADYSYGGGYGDYSQDGTAGYGGYGAEAAGDYSGGYGAAGEADYSSGYGAEAAADYSSGYGGEYGGEYGGDYGGDYGGGYSAPAAAAAAAPTRGAVRGLPRRGARGFNKALPFKSNNRFNPMGSGF